MAGIKEKERGRVNGIKSWIMDRREFKTFIEIQKSYLTFSTFFCTYFRVLKLKADFKLPVII